MLPIDKTYLKTNLNNWKTAILDPAYIIQKETLPTASAQNLGKVFQYIGSDSTNYTIGGFYQCQVVSGTDPTEYAWVEITSKTSIDNTTIKENSSKQLYVPKATNSALGVVQAGDGIDVDSDGVISVVARLEEIAELPTTAAALEGKIYLLTATQTGYTRGGIYMCEESTETAGTYEWKLISTSPLTAGKGITIENDVISADTNVFTGTLDEWDALTPAEQAKYDFIATPDEAVEDIADAIIDGDMRAITSNAVAQVVPSNASASNKLVSASGLNNRVREVFRIPYNLTITNFLARFVSIGIHVGEVFIEGNIGDTTVNHWCSYEANIISVTSSYVGNIRITDLNNGNEFLYQSYNTGSFNWVLVTERDLTPVTGTATPTAQLVSGDVRYIKSGNICTVCFSGLTVNTDGSNRLICTGLPEPLYAVFFGCVSGDIFYTMNVNTDGSLRDANNTILGNKGNIYGSVTYVCK